MRQASTNIFVIIGRPANTEFAPDGVVVDLRVYGCWNGGASLLIVVTARLLLALVLGVSNPTVRGEILIFFFLRT